MPGNFEGGLRLGGAYVDVGLDLSKLDRDLGQLRGQLERFAAGARVNVPVGASGRPGGGAGGGGGGVARPAAGVGAASLAGLVGAINNAASAASAAAQRAAQEVSRGIDGVIDRLGQVARNTAATAAVSRSTEAMWASTFRAERGEFHRAQSVRLGARALGVRAEIDRPASFYERLPSDVRFGSGIGAFGRTQVFRPRAAQAAAEAQQAIAPVVAELLQSASQAAQRAAAAAGRTTRAGGYPMRPGPIRGRRPVAPGPWDPSDIYNVVGGPDAPAAPTPRRRGRSGAVDIGLPAQLFKGAAEGARRVEAAIASMGHEVMLWLNRSAEAGAAFHRQLGRIEYATRPLRAVVGGAFNLITAPIRLAGRALGLFDDRVGATTNALRLMGRVSSTAGRALAAPFRVADAAAEALSNTLKSMAFFALFEVASRIVPWIGKSVTSAIGLNESMARVKATFGDAAGVATGFGETLVSRFGLARREIAETQAQFGTLLKGSGVARERAAGMANVLTKRAADISQRFGVGFEEAAGAISGALAGRTREVAQFGAVIRQADIQNRAMTLGFEGTGRSLTKSARAAAIYSLVLEGTAGAQGALERSANTTSRLMAELRGRIDNSAAAIGTKMEPAWQELLLLVNEVYEGSKRVNEGIRSGVAAVSDAVIGTIHVFRQMWQNWDATVELMGTLALQLGENLGALFAHLGTVAGVFLKWFDDNWATIFDDIGEMATVLFRNLVQNMKDLGAAFTKWIADPLRNPFEFKGTALLEGFRPQTPALELPELKLPNTYADKVGELIGRITGTELGRKAAGAVAAEKPLTDEEAAAAGRKERTTAGQIVGARELSDLLQKAAFDQEAKRLAQSRTKALSSIDKKMDKLIDVSGKPGVAVLG